MSNCSSLNIPQLPPDVRIIHDSHSSKPIMPYRKDGILYIDIKEARNVVKLYNEFFHKLRQFEKSSSKAPHHTSAGRRQQRRRRDFINMVLSLPEVKAMPDTHTKKFNDNEIYELYLKYKLRPETNRQSLPWCLPSHDSVLNLSYRYSKNQQRSKPPRDRYLEEACSKNKFFDKHINLNKTPKGYQNSMLEAGDKWWSSYFNQTVKNRPTPYINYRNLRLAKEMLERELSNYTFDAMSFWDVLNSESFKKIQDHSTGLTAPGFPNKREACLNKPFQEYVKNFMSELNAYGTFSLFFKNEAIKREKVQSRGPRVIVASTLEHEMLQRCTLQHFIESVMINRHSNPIKIGLKNTEFGNLFDYHTKDGQQYFYCADFTAQDKYMPRQLMTMGMDAMVNVARRQLGPEFASILQHALKSGLDKIVQYPNGQLVSYNTLFPTGQLDTANGNSRNHSLLWYYTLLQAGLSTEEVMQTTRSQYGDDVLLSDKGLLRAYQERIIEVSNQLGMPMTFDAWGERAFNRDGSTNMNVTFLKRSFAHYGDTIIPTYDTERILQKYLTPTQSYGPHHRSVEESIDRQFSFALLAGGNEKLYNQIMRNILYLGNKYGVQRDYFALTYHEMVSQFYSGSTDISPHLAPFNPNRNWEFDLQEDQNINVSAIAPRAHSSTRQYVEDTFFPTGPRNSSKTCSELPLISRLNSPADCWLRNIVSFERKPVVKAVVNQLMKDGYDLEKLRNQGLPHETMHQISGLLEKPIHLHMDVNYLDRSSNPSEIGHHIYADHATWVTPDGVFHDNSSTEAHQIESVYSEIPLEKEAYIGGILDLLKSAHEWKNQQHIAAITEACSVDELQEWANLAKPKSMSKMKHNASRRMKWRSKRAKDRLKKFFYHAERMQGTDLAKLHGNHLALILNSRLLQSEGMTDSNCPTVTFVPSSFKYVDAEPIDHTYNDDYTQPSESYQPLVKIPHPDRSLNDKIRWIKEIGLSYNVWIDRQDLCLTYFEPPTYDTHAAIKSPRNLIRIDESCKLNDLCISQDIWYTCKRCQLQLRGLAYDHAKICQSWTVITSKIQSRVDYDVPAVYDGITDSVYLIPFKTLKPELPIHLFDPASQDKRNSSSTNTCRNSTTVYQPGMLTYTDCQVYKHNSKRNPIYSDLVPLHSLLSSYNEPELDLVSELERVNLLLQEEITDEQTLETKPEYSSPECIRGLPDSIKTRMYQRLAELESQEHPQCLESDECFDCAVRRSICVNSPINAGTDSSNLDALSDFDESNEDHYWGDELERNCDY